MLMPVVFLDVVFFDIIFYDDVYFLAIQVTYEVL